MPEDSPPVAAKPLSAPQKALRKLGLVRPIDLALHLPLRYEDETRLTRLADARDGDLVQIEGQVTQQEVAWRPRRQLLVTLDDGSDQVVLRFFNFYPSQQKQMAVGQRLRARGELRGGFAGLSMMHPTVRAAGGALPQALTPVYPTVAGLPQPYLRKAVLAGLAQADLRETLPDEVLNEIDHLRPWDLRQALSFLHHPAPDMSLTQLEDHSHPAWQRLKAEELLAQQLSQLTARRAREHLRAPALHAARGGLHEALLAALPFQLTGAQRRVGEEIAHDLARAQPLRMEAYHERLGDQSPGPLARGDELARLRCRQRDRLFAQHVLARLHRLDGPRHMQVVGQRVVDGLDLGIGQHFLVAAIGLGKPQFRDGRARLRDVARRDRAHVEQRAALHSGNDPDRRDACGAQNPPDDGPHSQRPFALRHAAKSVFDFSSVAG